jgi:hypothetical protein
LGASLRPVRDLADAIETDGLSGLLRTLPRMTGQNGDFAQCVTDTDNCMNDAGSAEEFWGCARNLASCMREVVVDPAPPGGEDGEDGEEDGGKPGKRDDLATVALATFIFQLRRESKGTVRARPSVVASRRGSSDG